MANEKPKEEFSSRLGLILTTVGAAEGTVISLATTGSVPALQEGSVLKLRLTERLVVRFPQGGA